jgi:hypothetical protein
MLGSYHAFHATSCHVYIDTSIAHRYQTDILSDYTPPQRPSLSDPDNSWLKKKVLGIWYAVVGVLSRPAYAVPLLLNVTGSIWFFILIGKAELSLTVPITNSLAFLFTVLGEWWAEKKVISRGVSCMQTSCTIALTMYRHLDRHGICTWWYRIMRTEQVIVLSTSIISITNHVPTDSIRSLYPRSVSVFLLGTTSRTPVRVAVANFSRHTSVRPQ